MAAINLKVTKLTQSEWNSQEVKPYNHIKRMHIYKQVYKYKFNYCMGRDINEGWNHNIQQKKASKSRMNHHLCYLEKSGIDPTNSNKWHL